MLFLNKNWLFFKLKSYWFCTVYEIKDSKVIVNKYFIIKNSFNILKQFYTKNHIYKRQGQFFKFTYKGKRKRRYWRRRRLRYTRLQWFYYSRVWGGRLFSEYSFQFSYLTHKMFTPVTIEDIYITSFKSLSNHWNTSYLLHLCLVFMKRFYELAPLYSLFMLIYYCDIDFLFKYFYSGKQLNRYNQNK